MDVRLALLMNFTSRCLLSVVRNVPSDGERYSLRLDPRPAEVLYVLKLEASTVFDVSAFQV